MSVKTFEFTVNTKGFCHVMDITPEINGFLRDSGIRNGILTVFVPGSTAGITTIEYESGVISDLCKAIERLVPSNIEYEHNLRWGDGNGFSHVRASLMGPSLSIPVRNGSLIVGTWQQVVLCDFDNRGRRRRIVVQIVGE